MILWCHIKDFLNCSFSVFEGAMFFNLNCNLELPGEVFKKNIDGMKGSYIQKFCRNWSGVQLVYWNKKKSSHNTIIEY